MLIPVTANSIFPILILLQESMKPMPRISASAWFLKHSSPTIARNCFLSHRTCYVLLISISISNHTFSFLFPDNFTYHESSGIESQLVVQTVEGVKAVASRFCIASSTIGPHCQWCATIRKAMHPRWVEHS